MFRIDQAGLTTGVAGRSRTDGLLTGALVTLTNTSGGTTLFRLLWVAVGDTTAVGSLAPTAPGSSVWTFSPTANRPGTYRIQMIKDQGLPTEASRVLLFRVRTATRGLIIQALNEAADPRASLLNNGPEVVAASADNALDYDDVSLAALDYAGWLRAHHELVMAVDAGGGGGGSYDVVTSADDGLAPAIGSETNARKVLGFTGSAGSQVADWVDPIHSRIYEVGNGHGQYSTIHAALAAINAHSPAPGGTDRAVILVSPGYYPSTVPYEIPAFTEVRGTSKWSTQLHNDTTDLFKVMGDHTHFENLLIEGSSNIALSAFDGNNKSSIHVRNVDMLHAGFVSQQGFLKQSGATWAILFIEHCVVDSYRVSGYAINLFSTAGAAYKNDVVINDLFLDTYHLTNYGGGIYVEGCQDVRVNFSRIRSSRVVAYSTGLYLAKPGGQTGTPEVLISHSRIEANVGVYGVAGTKYSLLNTDALGALTAGTRDMRNSSV